MLRVCFVGVWFYARITRPGLSNYSSTAMIKGDVIKFRVCLYLPVALPTTMYPTIFIINNDLTRKHFSHQRHMRRDKKKTHTAVKNNENLCRARWNHFISRSHVSKEKLCSTVKIYSNEKQSSVDRNVLSFQFSKIPQTTIILNDFSSNCNAGLRQNEILRHRKNRCHFWIVGFFGSSNFLTLLIYIYIYIFFQLFGNKEEFRNLYRVLNEKLTPSQRTQVRKIPVTKCHRSSPATASFSERGYRRKSFFRFSSRIVISAGTKAAGKERPRFCVTNKSLREYFPFLVKRFWIFLEKNKKID